MRVFSFSLSGGYLYGVVSLFLVASPGLTQAQTDTRPHPLINQSLAMNTVVFSPRTLTWKAINDSGNVVRTGRGSGGRNYCRDIHRACHTPTGTYYVMSKGGADCRSTRFPVGKGGAPMPYCMFYSKYYAIHGSYDVPDYNASHGCIRVTPSDARWLSKNFVRIGTRVVVKPY